MILIVGASGTLGRRVVRRLLAEGAPVRAASRDPKTKLAHLRGTPAETAYLDLRDPATFRPALEGADVVVSAAHGFFPPRRSNTVENVDHRGVCALVDAAAAASVEHMILLSVPHAAPDSRSRFARAKCAAEERLRRSGVPGTVIRAEAFMETHVLKLLGEPLRESNTVRILGSGNVPLSFVATGDVAEVVVETALGDPPEEMRILRVMGPEALTRLEAVERLEKATGIEATCSHVPVTVMRVMRAFSRPVNPGVSYLMDAMIEEEGRGNHSIEPLYEKVVCDTTLDEVIERWWESS